MNNDYREELTDIKSQRLCVKVPIYIQMTSHTSQNQPEF